VEIRGLMRGASPEIPQWFIHAHLPQRVEQELGTVADHLYQGVIHSKNPLTGNDLTETDQSRQNYLKRYASADLLEQVMNSWKAHLQNFVPTPEPASKSNYTNHARWMVALKEVSPQNYETLLAAWRNVHQRRSNLWKAMKQVGLG
jgi:hypothetical protein